METEEERMDSNEILVSENFAAAQSLKNAWTRLASTYGCMRIVLYRKRLTITPHWFAKWLIRLLFLDLCHEIPTASIQDVKEIGSWSSYGKVEVHFQTLEGNDQTIRLYMKKHREFVGKCQTVCSGSHISKRDKA